MSEEEPEIAGLITGALLVLRTGPRGLPLRN